MHGKPYTYKEFYVIQWANYMIKNEDWSTLQAKFINSQINNAKKINLTKKQVEALKAVDYGPGTEYLSENIDEVIYDD